LFLQHGKRDFALAKPWNFGVAMGRDNPSRMKKEMGKTGSLLRLESRMRREKTLEKIWEEVRKKEEFVDREKIIADN